MLPDAKITCMCFIGLTTTTKKTPTTRPPIEVRRLESLSAPLLRPTLSSLKLFQPLILRVAGSRGYKVAQTCSLRHLVPSAALHSRENILSLHSVRLNGVKRVGMEEALQTNKRLPWQPKDSKQGQKRYFFSSSPVPIALSFLFPLILLFFYSPYPHPFFFMVLYPQSFFYLLFIQFSSDTLIPFSISSSHALIPSSSSSHTLIPLNFFGFLMYNIKRLLLFLLHLPSSSSLIPSQLFNSCTQHPILTFLEASDEGRGGIVACCISSSAVGQ